MKWSTTAVFALASAAICQAAAVKSSSIQEVSTYAPAHATPVAGVTKKPAKANKNVATATFTNSKRLLFDTDGNQIDAYGSKINFFNGSYYLYGNSFSAIGTAYGVKGYRSADLQTWQAMGNILDSALTSTCLADASAGGCGRPHILYNANSTNYVLWMNGGEPGYLVATSKSPSGPFTQAAQRAYIDPQFDHLIAADFTIEVANNKPYVVFSTLNFAIPDSGSIWPPIKQNLHISPLTGDYMSTTGVSYPVNSTAFDLIDNEAESPDLFYRKGQYYISASNTCGYCNSSIGLLYRSSSIKGPWTRQILSGDSCGGQVEGVLPLTHPGGKKTFLWHSTSVPGGPRTGFGGHIFQPLVFNKDGSVQDLVCDANAKFPVSFTEGTTPVTTGSLLTSAGDASPADAAYNYVCDSDQWDLYQLWTASKTGTIKSVSVNVARGVQTVPLSLTVFNGLSSYSDIVAPSFTWKALGSASYTPGNLTYVFDKATVQLTAPVSVKKGDILGLAITGADYSPYCHLEFDNTGMSQYKLFQRGAGQNSWRGLTGKTSVVYERIGKSVKFEADYA